MLPVIILAGGLATRLRPITETIPKALVEVAGKPFILHQLEYLKKQGLSKIVLSIGYLGEMIREVIGDGSQLGLEIQYSFDGKILLGTGGAIKKALPMLGNSFFVLYGDSFLPINFSEVGSAFLDSHKKGLMTVLKNENQWDTSNVIYENGQIIEYNKKTITPPMLYIDYGLGVLKSDVLSSYPLNTPFDLSDVYNQLSLQGQLAGFEVFQRFYEIGSLVGIQETENYLLTAKKESA